MRSFDGRPLAEHDLRRILEAGRLAPSSNNDQGWAFIVVRDRERLQQLSHVGDWAQHLANAGAAVALVFPLGTEDWEPELRAFDIGQAAQSMMLTAWELGIGSVHAAVYDEPMAKELLGYPNGWRCDYVLSFGYPADRSILTRGKASSARRLFGDIVHDERW